MVSLWREILCKLSIYTPTSGQWITIWWAKFELEGIILIFIYFNSEFKVRRKTKTKNVDFERRYIRTHYKERPSKMFCITFVIFFFIKSVRQFFLFGKCSISGSISHNALYYYFDYLVVVLHAELFFHFYYCYGKNNFVFCLIIYIATNID